MKRLVQVLFTVGLTWLIVSRVGVSLDEVLSPGMAMPDLRSGWLFLSTVVLLTGYFLSARLWGRMVGELGGPDPGGIASFRIVLTANLGRYLPGKLWQFAGLAILSRRHGASASVGTAAGVLSQSFALGATGVLALPLLGNLFSTDRAVGLPVLVFLALLLLGVGVPSLLRGALGFAFRAARVSTESLPRIDAWFGPRWLLLHIGAWIVYGLSFVVFVRGLGFEADGLTLAAAFAGAYLLGYVAIFAPAGIGVREGFLIAFLRPELGGAAVGIAILTRVWMTVVELLPAGGLGLWEVFRRHDGEATGRMGPGGGGDDGGE